MKKNDIDIFLKSSLGDNMIENINKLIGHSTLLYKAMNDCLIYKDEETFETFEDAIADYHLIISNILRIAKIREKDILQLGISRKIKELENLNLKHHE